MFTTLLTKPSMSTSISDDFTGSNGDPPDTNKWTLTLEGGNTSEIQSNKLRMTSIAGGGYAKCKTSWINPGDDIPADTDFDINIDWEYASVKPENVFNYLDFLWLQIESNSLYLKVAHYPGADDTYKVDTWYAETDYDGGDTASYNEDIEIGDVRGFRIKRVGSLWTCYRKTSIGEWVTLLSASIGVASVSDIHMSMLGFFTASNWVVDFDNFFGEIG